MKISYSIYCSQSPLPACFINQAKPNLPIKN